MSSKNNYELLIEKLDQFIRKFYLNQIIRGFLYSTALVLVLFLAFSISEHYYYFSSAIRKGMFWSFIGLSVFAFGAWVILPLSRYFKLGSVISHENAAKIIGEHFSNVQDKLLNVLQLKSQSDSNSNQELILASINQKSEKIKLVPFKSAIDLRQNKKYLKYTLPPLLLLLLILFVNSSLITDSTQRLIQNDKEFERPAPFLFQVNNEDLKVVQFEDYTLEVNVSGEVLPSEVFIDVDNYQYRLKKENANTFSYRFSNVQKDVDFKLFSGKVLSNEYNLAVLKKPNISDFEVSLDYPAYTGLKDEKLQSIGDLVIPQGTYVNWVFNALNTDEIGVKFTDSKMLALLKRFGPNSFSYKKRILRDGNYKIYVSNKALPKADSISYTLSVTPDQFPVIEATMFQDSLDKRMQFFVGEASDDYGLKSLTFNYRIKGEDGKEGALETTQLKLKSGSSSQFEHSFDLHELSLQPGDEVSYYFETWDNDGVNGSKNARTNLMVFEMPTESELEDQEDANNDKIKEDLKDALKESKKVQDDMKALREKLLQEKELKWQDKKEFEKLLERQQEIQNQIQQAKQNFEQNIQNQEEFNKTEENIMQKQEQLQKLFEESLDEEMQKLMEDIQELMEELEKEGALEKMEEMEMNDEELEQELDRMLELFKQLEVEKEMQDAIEKLEELAKKQEELADETAKEDSEKTKEELKKEQEKIEEEFKELEEKLEEIEEMNKELENPKDLGDTEDQEEEIKEDMSDSKEELDSGDKQKSSKKQKDAAQKMNEMANDMAMSMEAAEMEQMEEDMQALRQLLENLVTLSFEQEKLMNDFRMVRQNTPQYVDMTKEQFKLKDDFKLIQDSLHALSKRVFQIESFITEKVIEVNSEMKSAINQLEDRKKPAAAEHQQRTMKNVNDLALMLSETMEQMQQQMSGMMSGSQMCNKPGGKGKSGNKPSDKMSQGQKSVNEQMKQMKKDMQNGKPGSSKQFAQMAAKQAALREALRAKQKKLQEQGKGSQELEQLIDAMNKVETDLVNKKLTNEMLRRQEEILTRLLKDEKAEREREFDNKRKSNTAQQFERKIPPTLEEYLKKREAEVDLFKSVSPALKPYYKNLVEQYHKSLKRK